MEEVKPLNWLKNLQKEKWQKTLVVIVVVLFILIAIAAIWVMFGELSLEQTGFQAFAFCISLSALPLIMKRYGPKTISWLVGDAQNWKFFIRFAFLVLAGFVVIGAYQFLIRELISLLGMGEVHDESSQAHMLYTVGILLFWAPFTWYWIVVQIGGMVLWFTIFVWLAYIIVKFSNWLLWRSVEYNKGVVSAIVLLLTIGLAIIQMLLKITA